MKIKHEIKILPEVRIDFNRKYLKIQKLKCNEDDSISIVSEKPAYPEEFIGELKHGDV